VPLRDEFPARCQGDFDGIHVPGRASLPSVAARDAGDGGVIVEVFWGVIIVGIVVTSLKLADRS
jgi:hypothetical protein